MKTLEAYPTPFRRLRRWPKLYALSAFALLLASTTYWSWLSAKVQQSNADQLVNGFLLENHHTFASAFFPSTHTQLLKWPLFALLRYADFSPAMYSLSTILLATLTVATFSYLLYRIERRSLHFSILCLLLACALTPIPPQVFDTVTTPLNMAMLTGRNIEYICYIGVALLCLKAARLKSWKFLSATLLLAILLASDQMFTALSLGGSFLFLIMAWLLHNRQFKSAALRWFAASSVGMLGAMLLQSILDHFVTHIISTGSSYATPTWPNLMVSIKALGLNLGVSLHEGPAALLAVAVNLATVLAILWAAKWLISKIYANRTQSATPFDNASILAAMLLSSSVVAIVVYLITTQSYLGDARYLTIALFAGFVLLAAYLRTKQLTTRSAVVISCIAIPAILLGLYGATAHVHQQLATDQLLHRNQTIAKALRHHPVEFLAGNYWRVFPVKALSDHGGQKVVPLDSCLRPASALSSQAWRPDLRTHSFAYILTLHAAGAAAPMCPKQLIVFHFGHPTATILISGSRQDPAEMLLFYDQGAAEHTALNP